MKLHASVTSAFPAVLALASISLAVLLLPGRPAAPRSSGVPPALKLVAGDVVAAVEAPVRAVTKTQPRTRSAGSHTRAAAPPTATATATHRRASAPAQRPNAHRSAPRAREPQNHPTPPTPLVTRSAPTAAPKVVQPAAGHGHGKAKALGHARKAAAPPHGPPADVPQGPPVVPPGQLPVHGGSGEHGAPGARGGRK
jgi:hypothetical protein